MKITNNDYLLQSKIFSKKQIEFLKKNNLEIKRIKTESNFKCDKNNVKNGIKNLAQRINEIVFSSFEINIPVFSRLKKEYNENFQTITKNSTIDIFYLIEDFLELISDYVPSFKQEWAGSVLVKQTLKAISRKKIYEICHKENDNISFVDCNLFMNYKKANMVLFNLNGGKEVGNYVIVERRIK